MSLTDIWTWREPACAWEDERAYKFWLCCLETETKLWLVNETTTAFVNLGKQ